MVFINLEVLAHAPREAKLLEYMREMEESDEIRVVAVAGRDHELADQADRVIDSGAGESGLVTDVFLTTCASTYAAKTPHARIGVVAASYDHAQALVAVLEDAFGVEDAWAARSLKEAMKFL